MFNCCEAQKYIFFDNKQAKKIIKGMLSNKRGQNGSITGIML
jgi:hypothetical protein